ncbi:MAG: cyclase family protein [Candidatus Obscuribacterales bacterium]|jgi:kynurenine formamidase
MKWTLTSLIASAILMFSQQESPGAPVAIDSNKLVDLTHVLSDGIPDFHGDMHAFKYKLKFTVAKDGYADGQYDTPEHLGTHVDAPCHFATGAASIDKLPVSKLIVPCVVIDVRKETAANADYSLTVEKLKAFEKNGRIPQGAAVLLLTGWSDRWTKPAAYRNADAKGTMHFPGFSAEAADYLIERNVSYVGIDTLSTDPGNSTTYPVHHKVLTKGIYMIENLDALNKLPSRGALLVVGPLPVKGGTGCQARVFAILP